MTQYKGMEVADELAGLIRHMDDLNEYREALHSLQAVWDNLAMLGELSGTGVQIGSVRGAFGDLTTRLLNHLGEQARRRSTLALQAKAQVAIDVLVRNLFERTADIGFLATDHDLRGFAAADAAERERLRPALHERLREYQRKYSVYENIVLIGPDGSVLARLEGDAEDAVSRDSWIAQALASDAPYLEYHGPSDLRADEGHALIYACRVLCPEGRRPVAVLALCFRFADECQRIFLGLQGAADWSVMSLLDAGGRVIATSDALQVPVGANVAMRPGEGRAAQLLRFAGRRWLAVNCPSHGYQGYAGPGWLGLAMVPLEHAFPQQGADRLQLDPAVHAALMSSPRLFSDALRDIAPSADRIEAELKRAVWNGNVALGSTAQGRDGVFSRSLLREIGRTGARTREVFTRAIGDMNHTVVSAMLDDSRSRAALAIDIMDRNLYERANDCRWWALTTAFREALARPAVEAAAQAGLTAILQTIHGLYTVYANLVLFDAGGRIVAVSRQDEHAVPGRLLNDEWVRRCLALADTQSYCVSDFEASELYGGKPTCIHAAAVRAAGDARRVVGGIGIVFDAAPQFEAMLSDALPRDEAGAVHEGVFAVFIERDGRVIASSRGEIVPGGRVALAGLDGAPIHGALARVLPHEGQLYAVGACASSGYREYKGTGDPYRQDVLALVLLPLSDAVDTTRVPVTQALNPPQIQAAATERDCVDLASFAVGGQWYSLPCDVVVEAVVVPHVLPLAGADDSVRGTIMFQGQAVAVLDLAARLRLPVDRQSGSAAPILIVRQGGFPLIGVQVDHLGDHLRVPKARLDRLERVVGQRSPLVEFLVKPDASAAGRALLMVLSVERLARALTGRPAAALVAETGLQAEVPLAVG